MFAILQLPSNRCFYGKIAIYGMGVGDFEIAYTLRCVRVDKRKCLVSCYTRYMCMHAQSLKRNVYSYTQCEITNQQLSYVAVWLQITLSALML